MIVIFITAVISFFCGAITVVLFIWWLLGYLNKERKKNETNTN